jgi:hypothetical protein
VLLLEQEFTIVQVPAHLGHRDPETTLQYLRSAPKSVAGKAAVTAALGGVSPDPDAAESAEMNQLMKDSAEATSQLGGLLERAKAMMGPPAEAAGEPATTDNAGDQPEGLGEGEPEMHPKSVASLSLLQ